MGQQYLGRDAVLEAVKGSPPANDRDWQVVDNWESVTPNIQKREITVNDGQGRILRQVEPHRDGTFAITCDDTLANESLFWGSHGSRMSFRWSKEGTGSGKPYDIFQCLVSINNAMPHQDKATYAVSGTVEVLPTEGTY